MATVKTEGRRNWAVMSEYAYITTLEYIKLGYSLGVIQFLSAMRGSKLFWRDVCNSLPFRGPSQKRIKNSTNNGKEKKGGESLELDNSNHSMMEECTMFLLHDTASMAEITHGQSVSTRVMNHFRKQSNLVACAPREHQVVFEMAATDAALPTMKLLNIPSSVTYEEAVSLSKLLAEALAWEWYWLTKSPGSTGTSPRRSRGSPVATRQHTLALMLANSPEFNLIWMAVSEASVWMTLLDNLYTAKRQLQGKRGKYVDDSCAAAYHHCSTALLNTNLTGHSMLCHALECAKSEILVLEEKYVPVLFADDDVPCTESNREDQEEGKKKIVQLPHCVKRVFLWRGTPSGAAVAIKGVKSWMLAEVQRWNEERNCMNGNSPTALDLFDLVRRNYHTQQQQQQQQHGEEEYSFPILKGHILQLPPRVYDSAIFGKEWKKQISSIPRNTKDALLRFRPVMPVLHIYTSGTTGLPKAARFSHLRFFAAIFLASMLPLRKKTKEVLMKSQQKNSRSGYEEGNGSRGGGKIWSKFKRMFSSFYHSPLEKEMNVLTVYNCLPMYHTVGCVFCMGHLVRALQEQQRAAGSLYLYKREDMNREIAENNNNKPHWAPTARMIIRTKFSASRFTQDLQEYRVTVVQYIGEVLRYALHYERKQENVKESCSDEKKAAVSGYYDINKGSEALIATDNNNNNNNNNNKQNGDKWVVPFAFGNGLRSDIWVECKKTLGISQVVEFYSSTEGNVFIINLFDLPGVVGHLPLFPDPIYRLSTQFFFFFPFCVLKYDIERDEVWRHPTRGWCAYCGVGETGEIVGEIIQGFDVFGLRRFDGYHSKVETRKNIIRNVFRAGDAYFLSGDLVRFDRMGFVTFVDRVGETFRWKGENVSTTEVMDVVNRVAGRAVAVREAVVYGVAVPGREGRAGMAKLTLQPKRSSEDSSHAATARTTVEEERLFLQNELYGLLSAASGASTFALPSYAIPVCVRVEEEGEESENNNNDNNSGEQRNIQQKQQGGEEKKKANGGREGEIPFSVENQEEEFSPNSSELGGPTEVTLSSDAAHTTTTFKYRRHVLVREGYEFALTSSEPGASRVYVLVTKRNLLAALGVPPLPPSVTCGYVPLNAKGTAILGEHLQNCGW